MIRVVGFNSWCRLGIFLFTASRQALGPTQPPIQWVPGALSLGHEVDHLPLSSAEVKEWVELYIHSPIMLSWHGAQLKKSTGTTLLHLLYILYIFKETKMFWLLLYSTVWYSMVFTLILFYLQSFIHCFSFDCPSWEFTADPCLLNLQHLENNVLHTVCNFLRHA
jgi:hypothetical protein